MRCEVGRSVAQEAKPEPADKFEILLPILVVAALRHLVHTMIAAILARNDGIAAFNSRSEQKAVRAMVRVFRARFVASIRHLPRSCRAVAFVPIRTASRS